MAKEFHNDCSKMFGSRYDSDCELRCYAIRWRMHPNQIILLLTISPHFWLNPSKPKASGSSAKKKTMEALREFRI